MAPRTPRDGSTWAGPNEDVTWADTGSGAGPRELTPRSPLGTPERYSTPRLLGKGALGQVVRVFDRRLSRDVARKELLRESPRHRQRFLREVRITARLEHPNIVPLHDAGEQNDGTLFYTMRYVRGRSLGEALNACGSLEQRLGLLDHLVDVCQAIAFAHSQGVVHRDLKPDNIMLGAFGETWVVDWGLARYIDVSEPGVAGGSDSGPGEGEAAHITRDGAVVGTPLYMSPEQAAGYPVDPRSEVWSLGAVLYHLVAGRPPFEGPDARTVIDQVLVGEVAALSDVEPGVPRELAAIITRALTVERGERYANAAALAEDLRGFLQGRWVSAYEYGWSERLVRVLMRNRAMVALGSLAAVALVTLGVVGDLRVRSERAEVRRNLSASLAERALLAAEGGDLLQARQLAVRSLTYDESPISRGVLAEVGAAWSPVLEASWPIEGGCRRLTPASTGQALGCVSERAASWLIDGEVAWSVPGSWLDAALSPDEQTLAVLSGDEIRLLDVADGSERSRIEGALLTSLAWSSDGLAWAERGGAVHIGERVVQVPCPTAMPAMRWTGEGRLAVTCMNADHYLIDPDELTWQKRRSAGASYTVAVHPQQEEWLGGASLGQLHLWSMPGNAFLGALDGDGSFVYTSAWSPDGTVIAGGNDGGVVLIWDASTGALLSRVPAEGDPVATVAFSDDSQSLLTAGGTDIRRWRLPSTKRHVLPARNEGIASTWVDVAHGIAWARQGDGRIVRWNLASGAVLPFDQGNLCQDVLTLAGSPEGVVLTCRAGNAVVLDRLTGAPVLEREDVLGVADARFIDGHYVALARRHRQVWLVDLSSLEVTATIDVPGEQGALKELFAGPDSTAWVTSDNGWVWQFDLSRREAMRSFDLGEYAPSIELSEDGQVLIAGTRGGEIHLFDARDGTPMQVLRGHEHLVSEVVLLDPGTLVSSSWDKTIRIWDLNTGRERAVLHGHTNRISGVAAAGNGRLLSWSWDHTGRLWELAELDTPSEQLVREAQWLTGLPLEPISERAEGPRPR